MSCPRGPILESFEQGNLGTWGRAEEEFVGGLQYNLVNVMPACQPKKRSSKGLFNYCAGSINHTTVGAIHSKDESVRPVNMVQFCYNFA